MLIDLCCDIVRGWGVDNHACCCCCCCLVGPHTVQIRPSRQCPRVCPRACRPAPPPLLVRGQATPLIHRSSPWTSLLTSAVRPTSPPWPPPLSCSHSPPQTMGPTQCATFTLTVSLSLCTSFYAGSSTLTTNRSASISQWRVLDQHQQPPRASSLAATTTGDLKDLLLGSD